MAQKLKFGNGTWATKKGSTLAYNDENDNYKPLPFTTTRNSIGTRVNKEGLIEVVGNNIPRIDFSNDANGSLLLEPQRTNLILNSQKISLSPIKNGTFTDDFAISPDGTQNATKFTAPSIDPYFYQSVSFSAGSYTASIYVKGIGNSIGKDFRIVLGSNSSNPKLEIPSEWTRFEYTATMTSGSANAGLEIPDPAVVGDDVLVWGWQVEAGSYATSYIPTSGSTATRLADTANGSGNSEVFNDSEGVLFADIAALSDDLTFRLISLSDGTTSNRLSLGYRSTSNAIYCEIRNANATQAFLITTINDIKTKSKVSVKYKENDFAMWVNGFEVSTDTSGITPINLSKINFDSGQQSGGYFYGNTKEIGYYDTALTDEELEYLTSYRSLNELVTELNLNTL